MTTITAHALRSISLDMFADLTAISFRLAAVRDGWTTLIFDGNLSPEVQAAIRARLESRNDADQALREAARQAWATDQAFLDTTVPQLLAGADAIIALAGSSAQEKDLARGIKALTHHCEALTQQLIEVGRLVLADIEGDDA